MRRAMGVVRNGTDIAAGIEEMKLLKGGMPLLGRAVLMSTLAREESRGAHWRADFPQRDDKNFHCNTVARFDGEKIHISFESV